jgi:hypothetical protein
MKVGVNLINFGPSASAGTLRRWAEAVEGLGYHLLMTSDHIAVTPDVGKRYPAPPSFALLLVSSCLPALTRPLLRAYRRRVRCAPALPRI